MSNVAKAKFYFPNGEEYTSDIIRDSYNFQEILHNGLKAADGSCSFKIPFSIEIANQFKSQINLGKVKVEIKDKDDSNINTYYVKDGLQFDKTQKNQPISINAISPSFFLDETLPRNIVMLGKTVAEIISQVLKEINFTDIGNISVYKRLNYFVANEGEKAKDLINNILYEFGYVIYFDEDGKLNTRSLFDDIPDNFDTITQNFDGSNLREKVSITAKSHEADYVSASYKKVEYFTNTLIFSDTQNADDNNKCKTEIQSGYCMFESSEEKENRLKNGTGWKENLCEYDSSLGEVLYATGIRPDVYFDSGIEYSISRFDSDGSDLIDQCCLKAYNGTSKTLYCRKLDIYGDAWIATESNAVVSSTGTKIKDIELKYIQSKGDAETFAVNVANYYRFCNFVITAKSYTDYALGSYVKVTDYGIGTYYGRIVSKKRTLKNDCIEYTIETITDYTPAEIEKEKSTRKGQNSAGIPKGEKGDAGIDGSSLFVYLEQSSAVFNVDDVGKVEESTVEIPIHVICDGLELPFKLGKIAQPDGMSVEEYETETKHGIRIHTTKDYLLENGTFDIPIIYTEVTHAYIYGEHNTAYYSAKNKGTAYGTFVYDDTSISDYNLVFTYSTARLSIYRGAKNTISGFLDPSTNFNLHRGDWFTWTGDDTTATYNGVTVTFKSAVVYKWNGDYWEEDTNQEHIMTALSDVISVAKDKLIRNQSETTELLERLSNAETFYKRLNDNDDFVELLGANEVLADTLIANTAFINDLTASSTFTNKLVANETYTDSLATNSAFIDKLIACKAFIDNLYTKVASIDALTGGTITVKSAVNATNATNATNADHADNADSATDATNSTNVSNGNITGMTTSGTSDTSIAIHSSDWTGTGSTSGFGILKNGNAYFNNGKFRGIIEATSGSFTGEVNADTGTFKNGVFQNCYLNGFITQDVQYFKAGLVCFIYKDNNVCILQKSANIGTVERVNTGLYRVCFTSLMGDTGVSKYAIAPQVLFASDVYRTETTDNSGILSGIGTTTSFGGNPRYKLACRGSSSSSQDNQWVYQKHTSNSAHIGNYEAFALSFLTPDGNGYYYLHFTDYNNDNYIDPVGGAFLVFEGFPKTPSISHNISHIPDFNMPTYIDAGL